ncbi:MAG TPA: RNA polymerase factor sigma-54 [Spirochaetota bacterium]|nr:RNA polymerase factor sigma-54 [Spirochaetota bacterium]
MAANINFTQELSQKLSITPQMIQAVKLLQYSAPELAEYITHELADNPFLVEKEKKNISIDDKDFENKDEELHKQEYSETYNYHNFKKKYDITNIIESTAVREKNLSAVLLEQLGFIYDHDSIEYQTGEYIIGSLDKDGYLSADKDELIVGELNISREKFDEVLSNIKEFDPTGIASRDIKECLLKQVENLKDYDLVLEKQIINDYFNLLKGKKIRELSRILKEPLANIKKAVANISHLEPKPARKYSSMDNNYIIPDIIVKRVDHRNVLIINDEIIPDIAYSAAYKKKVKHRANRELKQYLNEKENKAHFLINSIKYRQKNITRVMSHILQIQKDFFDKGPAHLVPYTILKLSEELGINSGTLSRIINSKYVQTEWGIFNMRIFFSSSLNSKNGNVSSNKIKDMIKNIILNYQGDKKLTDKKIVDMLRSRGVKVARRTVAKYRKELQILSSFHR